MEKNYKEYLNHITTFIFDVDGVLTDGSIQVSTEGELLRTMNIKDGYALKTAQLAGFHVCIISGGKNEGVRKRLRDLGITNIYLGIQDKVEQLDEFFDIYEIDRENVFIWAMTSQTCML
jgi:3-deoxy-D-manno-octulosonate 8-phosphate phosphatase (KDO 8-P phosphatase)